MAEYSSPAEFIKKYAGKAVNLDGAYGVQCVDGFRVWCRDVLGYSWPTKTGWASGYWEYRFEHADEFDFITDPAEFQDCDWCIWKRGSRPCPDSHVAMYYQGKFFGQRQSANRAFCLKKILTDGVYGALRWKGYEKAMSLKNIGTATIKVDALNIRDVPSSSGNRMGMAENGKTYEIYGIYQDGTYTWYQIGSSQWIADNGAWADVSIGGDASKGKELNQKIAWYLTQIGAADKLLEQARNKLAGEE